MDGSTEKVSLSSERICVVCFHIHCLVFIVTNSEIRRLGVNRKAVKFPKLQIKPLERGAVLVVLQVLTSAARSGLSVRDLRVPM